MIRINQWVEQVHATAREKGWWERPRSDDELVMLMVTELAEATEAYRNGEPQVHYGSLTPEQSLSWNHSENWNQDETIHPGRVPGVKVGDKVYCLTPWQNPTNQHLKPEGEMVELIDCLIRIGDFCGARNINLVEAMNDPYARKMKNVPVDPREVTFVDATFCHGIDQDSLSRSTPLEVHLSIVQALNHPQLSINGRMGMAVNLIIAYLDRNAIDLEKVLQAKMDYNETRSHRHGGKLA